MLRGMATAISTMTAPVAHSRPQPSRLFSLDLFRGATIAAMIVVNNQSSEAAYWPLRHAEWNGWTPTDLVFPFFLFIVGVSLVLSFEARLEQGASRATLVFHTLRRSAVLFAIGLGLEWPGIDSVRPMAHPRCASTDCGGVLRSRADHALQQKLRARWPGSRSCWWATGS